MSVIYLVRHAQASFGLSDYDRLSKAMDQARDASEQCHRALISHIASHGC